MEIDVLIVYYFNNFCVYCLIWLFEEFGFDYEIKFYKCGFDYCVSVELKKVYLFGKLLVFEDDGLVIVESGVIFEYFLEKYDLKGFVLVKGMFECFVYIYWLYYVEGMVMLFFVMKLIFGMILKQVFFFMKFFVNVISGSVM